MPSFQDSLFIFVLALLLFGPKKLPELARYLGKLMNEFRRASSEFRLQMDDEFRAIEQAEQQKKIAAIEAAAPVAPLNIAEPEHPHLPAPLETTDVINASPEAAPQTHPDRHTSSDPWVDPAPQPVPIASNGDLHLMPPATGLPVSRSGSSTSVSSLFDLIPHTSDPVAVTLPAEPEAPNHG